MKFSFERLLGSKSELALVLGVFGILVVLFTPVPSAVLDFLLLFNLSMAILILLLTFYMDKPVEFSTFPAILLIATLLRLSLNIAATRLILSNADAGQVIEAVGDYVVAGNYIVGLVIFFILIIVQFIVVTSGAQRVAEVAARFTLDSMPGKQMSIDADLNMGLIDETEAQKRRKEIEKEANFYGSMDGASKFVKGDAIAGIIIILIDIVGGLAVGIAQLGMNWGDALHTYTLMTVGDGIVTQIPALIISTATGIIITRASSDSFLGKEIGSQLGKHPKSLVLVSLALIFFSILPGIPIWPVAVLLCIFIPIIILIAKSSDTSEGEEAAIPLAESTDVAVQVANYNDITVEPIEIVFGEELGEFVSKDTIFVEKVKAFRRQFVEEMGIVIPNLKLSTSINKEKNSYDLKLFNSVVASSSCFPDKTLAISTGSKISILGLETKDPSYGLPAVWIDNSQKELAVQQGLTVVDPVTVLFTHFSEIIKRNSEELLTRKETELLLGRVKETQPTLYDELIPEQLSLSDVQKVLKLLVKEKIPISNIELIAESLVDKARITKDPATLVESIRQQLSRVICEPLLNKDNTLEVITIDPSLERKLFESINYDETPASIRLDPAIVEKFIKNISKSVEQMIKGGNKPVLLCTGNLRMHIKKLTERYLPHLVVISLNEIPSNTNVRSQEIVSLKGNGFSAKDKIA
ncbi:flagellar biosynthesis protein FlhA [Microbulbifer sp. ANSA003]|uniref:flagellar biosynthesis protein FlhA n=1 Tax=unclassified Microbulbifer TaxID=2619833 RepID=UPI00403A0A08